MPAVAASSERRCCCLLLTADADAVLGPAVALIDVKILSVIFQTPSIQKDQLDIDETH